MSATAKVSLKSSIIIDSRKRGGLSSNKYSLSKFEFCNIQINLSHQLMTCWLFAYDACQNYFLHE